MTTRFLLLNRDKAIVEQTILWEQVHRIQLPLDIYTWAIMERIVYSLIYMVIIWARQLSHFQVYQRSSLGASGAYPIRLI